MATAGESHHSGTTVQESGIYECDGGDGHRWSTDVKGNVFPPLPDGCKGGGWRMFTKTPRDGR